MAFSCKKVNYLYFYRSIKSMLTKRNLYTFLSQVFGMLKFFYLKFTKNNAQYLCLANKIVERNI